MSRHLLSIVVILAAIERSEGFRLKRFLFTVAAIAGLWVLLPPSFATSPAFDAVFWGVLGAVLLVSCVANWWTHGDIAG